MSDLPVVDTFEYDISQEIKNKGATISDIASAGITIENKPEQTETKNSSVLIIFSIIFLFLSIAGIIWYMLSLQNQNKMPNTKNEVDKNAIATTTTDVNLVLQNIFPSLNENVGWFISKINKSPAGYDLTLDNYSQVFAFIIKNENSFAVDSAKLFNIELTSSSTLTFDDITIMNQNMRILNTGSSSIVYAFINDNHLLLSANTDGILQMRSAIIK